MYKFSAQKFKDVKSAKKCLQESLVGSVTTFGYIIPGHGFKGKQQVIKMDSDLKTMYAIHHAKHEILLWCTGKLNEEAKSRKRARDDEDKENSQKTQASMPPKSKTSKKMQEVNDIIANLKEKHGSHFSIEMLSTWAHMIHMKKHSSFDTAPNFPYFNNAKKTSETQSSATAVLPERQSSATAGLPERQSSATAVTPETLSSASAMTLSPYKRIHYRSECMDTKQVAFTSRKRYHQ